MPRAAYSAATLALTLLLPLLSTAQPAELAADRRPPNVVIFLADDQGWGDLGFNGNTNIATPHIDSLARGGAILDRFYVSARHGIASLPFRSAWAIALARYVYREIGSKVRRRGSAAWNERMERSSCPFS